MKKVILRVRPTAFSLIELVVVIAIIAIIASFTVPAANSVLRGSSMTQASQMLTDQISLARQLALGKNRAIEVRFYQFGDPESPGETVADPNKGRYRSMQLFEVVESGVAVPIDKIQRLPSTVVMNMSAELSTLIGGPGQTPLSPTGRDPELPRGVKNSYKYVSFRFNQDGSTNLRGTDVTDPDRKLLWFLTIHNDAPPNYDKITELKDSRGERIDFFTIQIDPVSGATKGYRPTAG